MTTTDPEGDRTKRPSRLETELAEILERADRPPSNIIKRFVATRPKVTGGGGGEGGISLVGKPALLRNWPTNLPASTRNSTSV